MGIVQDSDVRGSIRQAAELLNAQRFDEATTLLLPLLQMHPKNPEINFLLGSAYARQKKSVPAIECLERANRGAPNNPRILDAMGVVYDQLKRHDDAMSTYEALIPLLPEGQAKLQVIMKRGVAKAKSGAHEEAEEAFRLITARAPKYAPGWHNLGNTLVKLERREEAVAAFSQALKLDSENPYILYALGRSLLWVDQYTDSIDYLTKALKLAPLELQIMSYKILALRHAGRIEEADDLEGINDMVLSCHVPHPPEFGSLQEWNDTLRDEIVNHPSLTAEFENRATRNGSKVDHMFAANKTPIFELFERQVRTSFEDVIARMPKKQGHPLPLSVDKGYFADMWSNVMYDGGHQIPHNHPKGWFSACYYNQLPDRVIASGNAHEGWIEFGGTAYDFPEPPQVTKRQIQPEPGLMVVFPSYVFHRTIPFFSEEIRISCAFDAKPHGWKRS